MIKVSIIVPVYNSAQWLTRCMDSLLGQTLQEIEIILVATVSPDKSEILCMEYAKNNPAKVKVFLPEVNLRQGGSRNIGINAATGEYLGFVDSDDYVDTRMYELLYSEATNTGSDMCYCKRQKFNEAGDRFYNSDSYSFPTGTLTDANRRTILVSHVTFLQKSIYRRSIFIDHNIRFPEKIYAEDNLIDPLFFLYANKVAAVGKPLYFYNIRTGSLMTTKDEKKYLDRLNVVNLIVDEYKKRGFYEKFKNEINYLYYRKGFIHTVILYLRHASSPDYKVIESIRKLLIDIDSDYRKNPYYPGKTLFWALDRLASIKSNLLLKFLQKMIIWAKYYV